MGWICFALGLFAGCALVAALWGLEREKKAMLEDAARQFVREPEFDMLAESEETAYLQQYRNFLIYCGNGKGQQPIETEN